MSIISDKAEASLEKTLLRLLFPLITVIWFSHGRVFKAEGVKAKHKMFWGWLPSACSWAWKFASIQLLFSVPSFFFEKNPYFPNGWEHLEAINYDFLPKSCYSGEAAIFAHKSQAVGVSFIWMRLNRFRKQGIYCSLTQWRQTSEVFNGTLQRKH